MARGAGAAAERPDLNDAEVVNVEVIGSTGRRTISDEAADAVELLFMTEAAGLFRYAWTLPGASHSDAEDLVQVTFYAAAAQWERLLSQLDDESRRRWLYRVLRNKAID
jgi:DNA-directed RNA polymerase specialized sigma24 family protein